MQEKQANYAHHHTIMSILIRGSVHKKGVTVWLRPLVCLGMFYKGILAIQIIRRVGQLLHFGVRYVVLRRQPECHRQRQLG